MPPANTPDAGSTPHAQTRPATPPTAPGLLYLSSPVPDLAATLHGPSTPIPADDPDDANASFLRDSLQSLDRATGLGRPNPNTSQRASDTHQRWSDAARLGRPHRTSGDGHRTSTHTHTQPQPQPHVRRSVGDTRRSSQHPTPPVPGDTADDRSRRDRLQRVLSRLHRLHDVAAPPASSSTHTQPQPQPQGDRAQAYGNRTPSPHRQSLYDWAPAYDDRWGGEGEELEAILADLRRGHAEREGGRGEAWMRERDRRRRDREWINLRSRAVMQRAARQDGAGSPSATERMLRFVMERERSGLSEEEERARGAGWLGPAAAGGSGGSGSGSAWRASRSGLTDAEARMEVERQGVDEFRRGYLAGNAPPRLPRIATPPVATSSSVQPASTSMLFLENALKYLSELRECTRYEEALSTAIDHGFATKEFFADKSDDFVMCLDAIPPMPFSSWLQPGTVFEGHQHATSTAGSLTHPGPPPGSQIEQINPNFRGFPSNSHSNDHPPGSTRMSPNLGSSFDFTRPWFSNAAPLSLSPLPKSPSESPHDQWPVRVIIHDVDPTTMTLQGTMEAYDVPQHPATGAAVPPPHTDPTQPPKAGKKSSPITTYLEGHIIDLHTHTFLTPPAHPPLTSKNTPATGPHPTAPQNATPYTTSTRTPTFPSASVSTDAANWLRLPPFNNTTTTTTIPPDPTNPPSPSTANKTAHTLLSTPALQELMQTHIFMRWKERCFVHHAGDACSASPDERTGDGDRGHGLTISGFYYVSLRREDGRVEGLYFDPGSTPVQVLRLGGRVGWGGGGVR